MPQSNQDAAAYCDKQADSCRDSPFAEERQYEKMWRDRANELRAAAAAPKHAPEIGQLLNFYQVETLEALVLAQDGHIGRLQAKLTAAQPAPSFLPQRVREG